MYLSLVGLSTWGSLLHILFYVCYYRDLLMGVIDVINVVIGVWTYVNSKHGSHSFFAFWIKLMLKIHWSIKYQVYDWPFTECPVLGIIFILSFESWLPHSKTTSALLCLLNKGPLSISVTHLVESPGSCETEGHCVSLPLGWHGCVWNTETEADQSRETFP